MVARGAPALCLVAAIAALTVACGVREDVIAVVGHHEIAVAALQEYLSAAAGEPWQAVDAGVASRLLDQFLDQEIVAAAAVGQEPDVTIPLEPGARSAATRALLGRVCGAAPPVPDEIVGSEVERRLETPAPARAHVRQMLLDGIDQAAAVRRRLDSGEDFETVSRETSRAVNAATGGELGYLVQGSLPEDLDAVIFALEAGEISGPVQSPAGFHIFQVLEVVPAGPRRRAEVEAEVRRELSEHEARRFASECVGRLAAEVGVTVIADHLWFRYRGRYAEGNDADD